MYSRGSFYLDSSRVYSSVGGRGASPAQEAAESLRRLAEIGALLRTLSLHAVQQSSLAVRRRNHGLRRLQRRSRSRRLSRDQELSLRHLLTAQRQTTAPQQNLPQPQVPHGTMGQNKKNTEEIAN